MCKAFPNLLSVFWLKWALALAMKPYLTLVFVFRKPKDPISSKIKPVWFIKSLVVIVMLCTFGETETRKKGSF